MMELVRFTWFLPLIPLLYLFYNWIYQKRISVVGKLVLITGASSGVGKACAFIFHKAGARVILAARSEHSLNTVKADLLAISGKLEPIVVKLDLSDLSNVSCVAQEIIEKYGRIDVLINNAGMSYRGDIINTDISVHQKLMQVNYFGQIVLTKAFLGGMIDRKSGSIVGVSSIQGKLSIPFRSAYSASKFATQAYYDCLRAEVAHLGINVSVVSPGYIKTNLSINAMTGDGTAYGVVDKTTAGGMEPDDVAICILSVVQQGSSDVLLAPVHHRLVTYLKPVVPRLVASIMSRRAQKHYKLKSS